MAKKKSGEKTPLRSADRLLTVLRTFSHANPQLQVSSLSAELDLAESTIRRILTLLEQHGLVRLDPGTRSYVLDHEILRLAQVQHESDSLVSLARPIVDALYDEVSETIVLNGRIGNDVVRLFERVTEQTLSVDIEVASKRPIYAGRATGKIFLAESSDEELEDLVPERWQPQTPYAPSSRDELRAELDKIRSEGIATNDQETEVGVWSVAAGVRDATGALCAALTVPVPLARVDEERKSELTRAVSNSAGALSKKLRDIDYRHGGRK